MLKVCFSWHCCCVVRLIRHFCRTYFYCFSFSRNLAMTLRIKIFIFRLRDMELIICLKNAIFLLLSQSSCALRNIPRDKTRNFKPSDILHIFVHIFLGSTVRVYIVTNTRQTGRRHVLRISRYMLSRRVCPLSHMVYKYIAHILF